MLLVIFGAGASYDSCPHWPAQHKQHIESRPPLAERLFDTRRVFAQSMQWFSRCQPLIPFLRHASSVEKVLQTFQDQTDSDPERLRQLAAIRFYLFAAIRLCQHEWGGLTSGVTNYKALLDQIRHWRKGEPVCFVTFNYDTMFEDALPDLGIHLGDIKAYVASSNYKLIKVHGSVDWAHVVQSSPSPEDFAPYGEWQGARQLIDIVSIIKFTGDYKLIPRLGEVGLHEGKLLFPAIAIPVESKSKFECPEVHLEALRAFLPQVTKLLVIGWRGRETHFLELLSEGIQKNLLKVLIVAGEPEWAEEPKNQLIRAGLNCEFSVGTKGFTELIVNNEAEAFLRT